METSESSLYSQLRVPFGEKESRLYRPSEVSRGLACGCHCPECKAKLIVKCSVAGRLFFAHHRSADCPGGYEKALHKMGKQILLDAGRVWLPDREVTISVPLVFGETLSKTLIFESREVKFASAVSEKRLCSGFIPDVTAVLMNGASLHIEILVTHAVEDRKSQTVDNVMEIDLSGLSEETVRDSVALENEVLKSARRWWYRCSLIDELPKVQREKIALEARVPAANKRLERKKAAELEKERKAQREEERREALAKRRQKEREPWLGALKRMEHAEDFFGWLDMTQTMAERAKPQLASIADHMGFEVDYWPTLLNLPIKQEWVFKEDRRLWQSALFDKMVLSVGQGAVFSVAQALEVVEKSVGVRGWAMQLSQLKQTHLKQPYNQKKGFELRGVWFLEPHENRSIRSPYAVVLSYLKALCSRGVLAEVHEAISFQVLMSGPDIWEAQRRDRANRSGRRPVQSSASFAAVAQEVSRESLKREIERKERRKQLEKQIELSVIDAQSISAAGFEEAILCSTCKRHNLPDGAPDCGNCGSYQVKIVQLTEAYLSTLASRLRCMP